MHRPQLTTVRYLALCVLLQTFGIPAVPPIVSAGPIPAHYQAVWTAPPQKTPANHAVDGPLMGNGDMGVCLGGSAELLRFYLNKNDFWRLKSKAGQSGPRPVGGFDISLPGWKGAHYRVEQTIRDGVTVVTLKNKGRVLQVTSWVAATENLLIVELLAQKGSVKATLKLWAGSGQGSDSAAGHAGALYWATRAFTQEVDIPVAAAAALKLMGAEQASATVTPSRPVTAVVALASRFQCDEPLQHVKDQVSALNPGRLSSLRQAHRLWWDQYWDRSWAKIDDPVLEKAYYQSLYTMGAASRDPRFPPAIFGIWVTTDTPAWAGDYHLNYNHMAPFYGLYSANRLDQADPQDAPILDFQTRARWYAQHVTGTRGVQYPVGIGPLGIETTREHERYKDSPNYELGGLFFQQRSNAAYCLVNLAQRWRCTYDPTYGQKVYPLVRDVVDFWEDYLRFEEGRYVIYGDAIHEGSGQDLNPILSLGLLHNTFDLALDMSRVLDRDLDRRPMWQHILDHLSEFSFQERDGKTVFRYTEKGTAWWRDNTLGIQHIYPGNALGLDSSSRYLQVARNTIELMQRWLDFNGTNSLFPAAVRMGYDPNIILEQLQRYAKHTYANGFQLNNPHGIENLSTVPNTINEMLCMSHGHVLRVFPVWPRDRDAQFQDIRAWGAFLVSSALQGGQVQYVKIRSEQGRDCAIVNPWPEQEVRVYRQGRPAEILSGERFTCQTHKQASLILAPAGLSSQDLGLRLSRLNQENTNAADGMHLKAQELKAEHDPTVMNLFLLDDPVMSQWHGFRRFDFIYDTRRCTMVVPAQAAPGRPWVWRARFFGHEPQVDLMLLKQGFHLVYMDVAGLFGAPRAVQHWNALYDYLTESIDLNDCVVLEGMSRGGLMVYNWASANPEKVACIYADNPVCDFKSWPAGRGQGKGHAPSWQACLKAYGMTENEALVHASNPLDKLEPLARAVVPILHVCGTGDTVVPVEENSDLVEKRYRQLGGKITVIRKPGVDHHPHSLEDPRPIVEFTQTHTGVDKCFHELRGGLKNSHIKFTREKRGRVAFLGGSITYNSGWRDYVCEYLRARYPDTTFDFIAAGIPSTGSTPGAFRLERDVFKNGPVDLLFEEAAVNDSTNGRSDTEQIRGMEGIVRHARALNPNLDVVLMYFVDPGKMALYEQGDVPAVIRNHETVAEHYQVPSLNLALEVTERIRAGEFDWSHDFRNLHPSHFGQNVYFRAIRRMLDRAWAVPLAAQDETVPHALPAERLDEYSYDNGRLMSIYNAELGPGFSLNPNWRPADRAGTRLGFVEVPVLEATEAGASLKLRFTGRAVGLFVAAGPDVGILEYSVDGSSFRELNQFTPWSSRLHLPWAYVLVAELDPGPHELAVRTTERKDQRSRGHACRIVHFLVN